MTSERLMTKDFIALSHPPLKIFEVFQSDVTGFSNGTFSSMVKTDDCRRYWSTDRKDE